MKIKESETRDKYLDLARELKKQRVRVIPIMISTFEMVPKGFERGLKEIEIRIRITEHIIVEIGLNIEEIPREL